MRWKDLIKTGVKKVLILVDYFFIIKLLDHLNTLISFLKFNSFRRHCLLDFNSNLEIVYLFFLFLFYGNNQWLFIIQLRYTITQSQYPKAVLLEFKEFICGEFEIFKKLSLEVKFLNHLSTWVEHLKFQPNARKLRFQKFQKSFSISLLEVQEFSSGEFQILQNLSS